VKKCSSKAWRVALGLALALLTGAVGGASQSPYSSIQGREIKALSPEQIDGYETGQGMSLALAAELNGYPGPKHVLELEAELGLTEDQLRSTETIFKEMKESAEDLGHRIVEHERKLDRLFATHVIDGDVLGSQTQQIALLQGRLRTIHLQAHLEMMEVLNEDQVARYIELRGYHADGHQGHHPGQSHGEHE